jgi:hypothetical protein
VRFGLAFFDNTRTKLSSDAFFVPTGLDGWTRAQVEWGIQTGPTTVDIVRGDIDTVFVIPEPTTALLVGLGLVCMAAQRHRSRVS